MCVIFSSKAVILHYKQDWQGNIKKIRFGIEQEYTNLQVHVGYKKEMKEAERALLIAVVGHAVSKSSKK